MAKPYWNQEPKIIRFSQKLPARVKDESRITNEVQEFIHSNIKALVLDQSVLDEVLFDCADLKDEILIKRNAELFRQGAINVRGGGKQRRVSHRLTVCPREMRPAFRLKHEPLAEFDIPCCQPTLLLFLGDKIPEAECNDYKDVLRKDIYAVLTPKIGRDRAKKQFGRFAFGRYKRQNEFGRRFSARFPTLTKLIRNFPRDASQGRTLNCILQDLEADICIYTVVRKCMEQGVFVVPVHDSFIIRPESFELVNSIVKAEFERRSNFPLDLKRKGEHTSTDVSRHNSELLSAA